MKYKKSTISVHHGLNNDKQYGSVATPIYLSSTYSFKKFKQTRLHDYSRRSNPTRDIVQNILSKLEGGVGAILTNSGMSAIHLICASFLSPNDLLIAPYDCYGGSYRLFHSQNKKLAYRVEFINQGDLIAVKNIMKKKPKLILIESPSNPLLNVVDIQKICQIAKKSGTLSIVDNTFLTPILQNPISLGADLVVHSCTKYLNGHSDVVSGVVVAKSKIIYNELKWWANNIGVTGGAFDSYLLLRGLRTLSPRIKLAQKNALAVINYLKTQKLVQKIYHPSLINNIGHQYALKQQRGFGSMLSFELLGDEKIFFNFLKTLKLFTLAESLGGVESLICHPETMTHAGMEKTALKKAGIKKNLLRISVGIEDKTDLIFDLDQAFKIISTK